MPKTFRKRLAGYLRAVTARKNAARGLTVYPDDTFLVSYPRSGNTWTRFLVANLINPDEPVTFATLESRIPEIYDVPDRVLRRFARPRIIKSHESFDPRYRKIIYIVRDPRDVAVSYYEFQLKRRVISEDCNLEEFIPRFMDSEFEPTTGSWGDHVLSWLATRQGRPNFLLLRYEDMQQRTADEAARIAGFLGLDQSPGRVARAVELSSSERMRKLEREQASQWKETKKTRLDKPFVRKAVAGGWKSTLPEGAVIQIETAWGQIMRLLGYELSTRVEPQPLPEIWNPAAPLVK
jgi:uncharacterized membrane protein YkvA (DUF1232 family)